MSKIPLVGDPGENATILKFVINTQTQSPDKVKPYMDKIILMCLKILTDSESRSLIEEPDKILTAKFIKNVICAEGEYLAQL